MVMKIDEILKGEWITEDEFLTRCPWKDHETHNHCYVNVTKKVFYCHYCGESGTLKKLLDEYEVADVGEIEKGIAEKKKYEKIDFSQFPKVEGKKDTYDRLAISYLKQRGLGEKEIEEYDIRYSSEGRFFGRVIIPIYENGIVVCFVARGFIHFVYPKYRFPKQGQTMLTTSEAVFDLERGVRLMESNAVNGIAIVEGAFDAISITQKLFGYMHGVAIMSKYLSLGQKLKLLRLHKNTKFYVLLDADAHKDALKVAKALDEYRRERVYVGFLEKGDPASASREELEDALWNSQLYSPILKMKVLLEG